MKKIYLFLGAALIATTSFAQYKAGGGTMHTSKNMNIKIHKTENNKAAGDSLFYFDSEGFYLMDSQDNTDFALQNADYDGGTPAQTGWPSDFIYSFYNDDAAETPYTTPGGDFFPNDLTAGTDTAFYIGASSWFTDNPIPQANNWWSFGPITIPANTTGNTFNWHDKHNPMWTDAYDLFIVDMSNVSDPANPDGIIDCNGLTADFTKTQISNGPNQADTSWTHHSVSVDGFAGSRIFVFFNHNANDGDALFLDEMYVVEGTPNSIEEFNGVNFNVYPNPSKGIFTINLNAQNINNSTLIVKNVVGQTVIERTVALAGRTQETISLEGYSKGIYFLTIENKTVKLIVE